MFLESRNLLNVEATCCVPPLLLFNCYCVESNKETIWVDKLMDGFKMIQENVTLHRDIKIVIHLMKNQHFMIALSILILGTNS